MDQLLFIEILTSDTCDGGEQGDRITREQLLANMSDEGAEVVGSWLSSGDSDLFESPAYLDALHEEGEAAKLVSEQFFDEAGEANGNGDNYELAATILTIVLFFAGISVVIVDRRISWGFSVRPACSSWAQSGTSSVSLWREIVGDPGRCPRLSLPFATANNFEHSAHRTLLEA